MPCRRVAEEDQPVHRLLPLLRLLHLLLLRFLPAPEHLPPLAQAEGVEDEADVAGLLAQQRLLVLLAQPLRERRQRAWAWAVGAERHRQRHQPRDCSDRLSW